MASKSLVSWHYSEKQDEIGLTLEQVSGFCGNGTDTGPSLDRAA